MTIIYPYRNREIERIKRSLDSLANQTNKNFKVLFIDYGSDFEIRDFNKKFIEKNYSFVKYEYSYHIHKPWSKAKAINIALKEIETPFVFVADIDMIFASNFIQKLQEKKDKNKVLYFKVGFLSEIETKAQKEFNEYKVAFKSSEGATGLTLFPTEKLKAIGGFDEFYHFWGAEDTDAHIRLQNMNIPIEFYDKEILMLHQWHPIYRSKNEEKLTQQLRIANIVRLNHEHLEFNLINKVTKVNSLLGTNISKLEYEKLQKPTKFIYKTTIKSEVDYILKELQYFSKQIVRYKIVEQKPTFKDKLKVVLKKKEPIVFYTLKEVNDLLLKELLIHYSNYNYSFVVAEDLKSITFTIAL